MTTREIQQALSAPFAPDKIGWKAQSVKNNRALAVAYCDARDVMDRLDEAVGVENWEDSYDIAADGSVVCQLRVKIGESWVVKSDVGSQSEQPDSGDRLKAAFSDALKRAAVKFGIGRYLYSLPAIWCDYDPARKQLVGTPQLPAWALPGKSAPVPKPAPATDTSESNATAKTLVARLQGAKSRDEAVSVWKDFERLSDALTDADRQWVRQAFGELKARFPAPAKS